MKKLSLLLFGASIFLIASCEHIRKEPAIPVPAEGSFATFSAKDNLLIIHVGVIDELPSEKRINAITKFNKFFIERYGIKKPAKVYAGRPDTPIRNPKIGEQMMLGYFQAWR